MTYMHCNFKNISDMTAGNIYITHLHIHKSHFTPNDLNIDV